MASIHLRDIHKVYGTGHTAVRGVSLDVADGELVVLVGPSGCGKSTTLRLVAGLESPTRGRLHLGEVDVTDVPPRERDLAMVFQSYALYPHKSVRDNLAFGLKMRGTDRTEIRRRVAEVAERLGLGALLDRKPAALSGASASEWPWAAPSSAAPGRSSSTSRSPTSTRSCASAPGPSSPASTASSPPRCSTSPTTRRRR
jgi:ABC-type sugar transport system ATPase subunit